jgi:hypothetical protein
MFGTLKQQVAMLEATCHRALQEREDPLVRQSLVEALLVFYIWAVGYPVLCTVWWFQGRP